MNKSFPKIIYAAASIILAVLVFRFSTADNASKASMFIYPHKEKNVVKKASNLSLNNLQDLNNAFVNIAKSTNPTVVTVYVSKVIKGRAQPFNFGPFQFFEQNPRREQHESGMGSGVIVKSDGYILTNNHVVSHSDSVVVQLYGGKRMPAKVVGTDPKTDLAVIKINAKNLPVMRMGNSDSLHVGQLVMAVGSPLDPNLSNTVTLGIVSAKGREGLHLAHYENYIQTDAAINPGNSGGALVNMDGKLVGINSAIATQSGGNQGIGFSIPVNMAERIMHQIIKYGKVRRGFLNVMIRSVSPTMAQAMGLKNTKGALIADVNGNPAKAAGLKQGDIVLKLNGQNVKNANQLVNEIASTSPGTEVTLTILRNGKQKDIKVKLGDMSKLEGNSVASGGSSSTTKLEKMLHFAVHSLTSKMKDNYGISSDIKGVIVTDVDHHSQAYANGLREGDVIMEAGYDGRRYNVKNEGDFSKALSGVHKGSAVFLKVFDPNRNTQEYLAFQLY
ncbi:MAG TPA: Do family serine endopeptidase [Balneolales bacterium]|nr:Do family serine endopeptidase [Balneolales bacterium]